MDEFKIQQQQLQQPLQQQQLDEEIEMAAFRSAVKQGEFKNIEDDKFRFEEMMEGSLALRRAENEKIEFTESLKSYPGAKRLLYNSKGKKRGYFDRKNTKDKVINFNKEVKNSEKLKNEKSDYSEMYAATVPMVTAYNLSSRAVLRMIEHTLEANKMSHQAYLDAIKNNKELSFVKELQDIKTKTDQYNEYVQITENDIGEYFNKEITLRSWEQICTEIKTMPAADAMLNYKESLVGLSSTKEMNECGMASQIQHFPKIIADAYVKKSSGFLTRVQNKGDGKYSLKPSVPAVAIPDYKIEDLRRSYNLLCKLFATYALNQEGKSDYPSAETILADSGLAFGEQLIDRDKPQAFDKYMKKLYPKMKPSLKKAGLTEKDFIQIQKLIFASDTISGGSARHFKELGESITGAIDKRKCLNIFLKDYKKNPNLIDKLRSSYNLYKDAQEDDFNKAVEDILKDFQKQSIDAVSELESISKMNVDSEDVPLFGACSSNAGMISSLRVMVEKHSSTAQSINTERLNTTVCKYFDKNGAFEQMSTEAVAEILNNFKGYQAELHLTDNDEKILKNYIYMTYKPDTVPDEKARTTITDRVKQILRPLSTFEYHFIAPVSESDKQVITVEAFAAETSQLCTSPFQSKTSFVGVYKKSNADEKPADQSMRKYYGKDISVDLGKKKLARDLKEFIVKTYPEMKAAQHSKKK